MGKKKKILPRKLRPNRKRRKRRRHVANSKSSRLTKKKRMTTQKPRTTWAILEADTAASNPRISHLRTKPKSQNMTKVSTSLTLSLIQVWSKSAAAIVVAAEAATTATGMTLSAVATIVVVEVATIVTISRPAAVVVATIGTSAAEAVTTMINIVPTLEASVSSVKMQAGKSTLINLRTPMT